MPYTIFMISYITGSIIGKQDSYIVLQTNGIGFKIFTTPNVIELPIGSNLSLHTYLQVREDALVLFGFFQASELHFFELLLTVSGVGPKVALSILASQNTELVKNAIASQDLAMFTRIGGVGKKTAEKIIVELKDKIGVLSENNQTTLSGSDDMFVALENLGYSSKEIKEIITKIDPTLTTEEKLRQALKFLSR